MFATNESTISVPTRSERLRVRRPLASTKTQSQPVSRHTRFDLTVPAVDAALEEICEILDEHEREVAEVKEIKTAKGKSVSY